MCAVFIYAWFLCHVIKLCCIRLLCWGKWNHVEAHGLCSHRGPLVGQRFYYSQGPCCCLWCCGVTTKPHEDSMVRDDDWSHVKVCGHRKAGLALLSPQYCGVLGMGELVQCYSSYYPAVLISCLLSWMQAEKYSSSLRSLATRNLTVLQWVCKQHKIDILRLSWWGR